MAEYFFGLHEGHLKAEANKIAERHDAWHTNHTDPGTKRKWGWFSCRNMGRPYDQDIADKVMADIDKAGGFDALTKKT